MGITESATTNCHSCVKTPCASPGIKLTQAQWCVASGIGRDSWSCGLGHGRPTDERNIALIPEWWIELAQRLGPWCGCLNVISAFGWCNIPSHLFGISVNVTLLLVCSKWRKLCLSLRRNAVFFFFLKLKEYEVSTDIQSMSNQKQTPMLQRAPENQPLKPACRASFTTS